MSLITGSLPRRYARALITLGQEEGLLETLGQDLERFVSFFKNPEGAEMLQALSNDLLSHSERTEAMREIADRFQLHPYLKNFLLVLMSKERAGLLPEILREYQRFSDRLLRITRVTVRAPQMPTQELLHQVSSFFEKNASGKVIAHGEARPDLIGGLLLELEEKHIVYDGSVKRELERIKETLLKTE